MADLTPFPPYERNFGNMFPDSDATRQSPGRAFSYVQNGLAVTCRLDAKGRVCAKRQELCGRVDDYAYRFDDQGHLLEVRQNGRLCEQYGYDRLGRRVMQRRAASGEGPAAR